MIIGGKERNQGTYRGLGLKVGRWAVMGGFYKPAYILGSLRGLMGMAKCGDEIPLLYFSLSLATPQKICDVYDQEECWVK